MSECNHPTTESACADCLKEAQARIKELEPRLQLTIVTMLDLETEKLLLDLRVEELEATEQRLLQNLSEAAHEHVKARTIAQDRIEQLEAALQKSTQALDDWTSIYASEFCDEARVEEAHDRIKKNGGTLAYIADIVCPNHELLKRS